MSASTAASLLSTDLAALVDRVGPSVVSVRAGHTAASGTAVGPARVVMANHGLDPDVETAQVVDGERAWDARVLGRDAAADLALLAVEGAALAPIETAAALPPIGGLVLSVGRAWDRLTAGCGIVQAHPGPLQRRNGGRLETVIRTTITPYPGYSGGPLMDAAGRMVGLATAGIQRGAGLALPVADVDRLTESLSKHGRIRRGFVGVTSLAVELPPSQQGAAGERRGLLVTSLADDGPAARAGLLVGDVVVSVAGMAMRRPEDLMDFLAGDVIGQAAALTIVRGTSTVPVTVTIGERGASH